MRDHHNSTTFGVVALNHFQQHLPLSFY